MMFLVREDRPILSVSTYNLPGHLNEKLGNRRLATAHQLNLVNLSSECLLVLGL